LSAPAGGARLTLITRTDCHLCEELLTQLEALRGRYPLPALAQLDVDADPILAQRFGLKVPVLLLDGVPVCHFKLDSAELLRLLRL
jgi:thioredoxin-like negative regulator of GroEL